MLTIKKLFLSFSLLVITPVSQALTVLYDGQGSVEEQGWLFFGQFPLAESLLPQIPGLPHLPASVVSPLAEGVGTASLNTDLGKGNRGYVGYANYSYAISLEDINIAQLLTNPSRLLDSGNFSLYNANFPILDRQAGFEFQFTVAITEESSQKNRAGFSVIVISDDGLGIELGFKQERKTDRIFAQSETFKEAEDTQGIELDLSESTDYVLSVAGELYELFANGEAILTGELRQYQFDPTESSPPLPFNPYQAPNFLFLGDDTDKAYAHFTLGTLAIEGASTGDPATSVPPLGEAVAVNAQGETMTTAASFAGGVAVADQAPQTEIVQSLEQPATVSGEITVDPAHVNETAHLFVYAAYSPSCSSAAADESYYMLNPSYDILLWDQDPSTLVAFSPDVTLAAQQPLDIYDDTFLAPGCLKVFFGYQVAADGLLITNSQPIQITIE